MTLLLSDPWAIVYDYTMNGWYIVRHGTRAVIAGPFPSLMDAELHIPVAVRDLYGGGRVKKR